MERGNKISVLKLMKMKETKQPVVWVTAYDLPFSQAAEQAGIDMILVGDSGGMVQLGHPTTNPVTMDEMIVLARAARCGAPDTFLIGDMPQGSYEPSDRDAILNALRFVKEAGCDAIKCEGGQRMARRVRAMVDAGILVMGHLGLTPQSTQTFSGYRVQAKTKSSFEKTFADAAALVEAGVFAILLEALPAEPAGQIARQFGVPIYGIGSGPRVDGQLLIMHDLMGFYAPFRPWFAKCYVPEVAEEFAQYLSGIEDLRKNGREQRRDGLLVLAEMAIGKYIAEVRGGEFPGTQFTYPLTPEELAELKTSKYWKP
jgi:3-methyl-2-oxobutanoate hydroxymethyltransferase